jgi:hypothetical protein
MGEQELLELGVVRERERVLVLVDPLPEPNLNNSRPSPVLPRLANSPA